MMAARLVSAGSRALCGTQGGLRSGVATVAATRRLMSGSAVTTLRSTESEVASLRADFQASQSAAALQSAEKEVAALRAEHAKETAELRAEPVDPYST